MHSDDHSNAPQAKFSNPRQTKVDPTNWDSLPREVQIEIARHLVDPKNVTGTYKNFANLGLASRSANIVAENQINPSIAKEVKENKIELEETKLGRYERDGMLAGSKQPDWKFFSLKTPEERSSIMGQILRRGPPRAEMSLVSNIEYFKPEEKVRIVNHVCDEQTRDGIGFGHIRKLIDKAEHLEAEELSRLVKASCGIRDKESRRTTLESWSGKTRPLSDEAQRKILSDIMRSSHRKGQSLALFAQNIDGLTAGNRSYVTTEILKLPDGDPNKWEALSHLARHLPELSAIDRDSVTSHIISRSAILEQNDTKQPWYSKPDFCRIEAIHHMSNYQELSGETREWVNSAITKILDRSDENALPLQAQLIPHMSDSKRSSFVRTALDKDAEGIVYGLTIRVADLNDSETQAYISHLESNRKFSSRDAVKNAVGYNIRHNLKHFSENQRTTLVERRLAYLSGIIRISDGVEAIESIAQNAKYLRIEDVANTIGAAQRLSVDSDPLIDPDLGSMDGIGHAAQCLTNWAKASILNPSKAREATNTGPRGVKRSFDALDPSDITDRSAKRAQLSERNERNERGRSSSVER